MIRALIREMLAQTPGGISPIEPEKEDSEISPSRFQFADVRDIVQFVDDILNGTTLVDITEKVAGQHFTIVIKDNFVYGQTKDQILRNSQPSDARYMKFGSELAQAIISLTKREKIADQTWRFEMLHPMFNHDYIKYKNKDVTFVEYTGRLTDDLADKIRKYMRSGKLLVKSNLRPKIKNSPKLESFRRLWSGSLRRKVSGLITAPDYVKKREIAKLQDALADVLESAFSSVVDDLSPVEGVVVKAGGQPFKISSSTYRIVQRAQLPLYSYFKCRKNEVDAALQQPTKTVEELRLETGLPFSGIYSHNATHNIYDTIRYYLEGASRLTSVNTENYNIWFTPAEAKEMLSRLTEDTCEQIYYEIYNKAKA